MVPGASWSLAGLGQGAAPAAGSRVLLQLREVGLAPGVGQTTAKVGKNMAGKNKDCEPAGSLHAGTVGVSVGTSAGEWVTEAESLLHKRPQDLRVAPQESSKLGMKSS